jgi:hypothetical protein
MEGKATTMLFIPAILIMVVSTGYKSLAQESAPHPLKHFTAPNQSAVYDGSPAAPDQDMEVLKRDLKSQNKQIVAANMNLTDAEAEKFWPVYDRYAADLATIYDTKMALVQEYLGSYKTMSDEEAESYIRRHAAVDVDLIQLRLKYVPAFRKVLSSRQTALLFQIEWRLDLMINMQLAQMPVIDP